MDSDVFEEDLVLPELGEQDLLVGAEAVKVRLGEERRVLGLDEDVARGIGRGDGHEGDELHDLSVDGPCPGPPRRRHAVVAVFDKVGVPDLVQLDRGQDLPAAPGILDLPQAGGSPVDREKRAVEVLVAVHAPHDLLDLHLLEALVAPGLRPHVLPHPVERKEQGRLLADVVEDPVQQALPRGAGIRHRAPQGGHGPGHG
jgi:hypothetical protein